MALTRRLFSWRRISVALAIATTLVINGATNSEAAVFNSTLASSWLASQQKTDGGFEVLGSPGFETPDAALAIAEQANAGSTWKPSVALAAVEAQKNTGLNALNYLDSFIETTGPALTISKAGEISLLASALGINPSTFDPNSDGSYDLLNQVRNAAHTNGSYGESGAFSATLFSILALRTHNDAVGCNSIDYIFSTQQANGGFNYAGDKTLTGNDFDTTGRTLMTLASMGIGPNDSHVAAALSYLAQSQQTNGGFIDDFQTESNASATALVDLGLRALGINPATSTWRDKADPALAGRAYVAPEDFLATKQQPDGHIANEYDSFGVNTVSTTQSIQALSHSFVPGLTDVTPATCIPAPQVLSNQLQNSHNQNRYRFAFSDGRVTQCVRGSTCSTIFVLPKLNSPIVTAAVTPSGNGFWLFAADGGVFTSGDAQYFGGATHLKLQGAIVGAKAMPDGSGYALFARDGGVFNFGSSQFYGSANPFHISDVVGGGLTSDGKGYDLFGADGGVFSFGNATFHGSLDGTHLSSPITGGDVAHTSDGYVMFGADGGVFNFGNVAYQGSMAGSKLNAPIASGIVSDDDRGYTMVGKDGGVFSFGAANFVAAITSHETDVRALIIG